MQDTLLLIPDKIDIERDALANAWEKANGQVLRISKFWEKPNTQNKKLAIYGPDTFSLVLAQVVSIQLISPQDEWIAQIDKKWTKRFISIYKINSISSLSFPAFIKPITPKIFKAQTVESLPNLQKITSGLNASEQIIVSEIIAIQQEVRAFILNRKISDMAFYEGTGKIEEAHHFLTIFLETSPLPLPKTFVIDIGYNAQLGWFLLEFNATWGAGLNGCNPDKVIACIAEASF